MAQNLIIVDSCVFIKAFRGEKETIRLLIELENKIAYSHITYLELLVGCKTAFRKNELTNAFKGYYSIPVDFSISNKAIELMFTYTSGQKYLSIPDCFIASTQLITGYPLLTYNTKDFESIEGIHLFNK